MLCFAAVTADGPAPTPDPGGHSLTAEAIAWVPGAGERDGAVLTVGPSPAGPPAVVPEEPVEQGARTSGWPCLRCGATVAFGEPRCPQCGAGFLAGAGGAEFGGTHAAARAPLPRPQRVLLVIAGAALVMGVLTGLAYLAGGLL